MIQLLTSVMEVRKFYLKSTYYSHLHIKNSLSFTVVRDKWNILCNTNLFLLLSQNSFFNYFNYLILKVQKQYKNRIRHRIRYAFEIWIPFSRLSYIFDCTSNAYFLPYLITEVHTSTNCPERWLPLALTIVLLSPKTGSVGVLPGSEDVSWTHTHKTQCTTKHTSEPVDCF